VEFTGEKPTLLTQHKDMPGVISKISSLFYDENMNIGTMKVYRSGKGKATMALETDSMIPDEIINKIKEMEEVENVEFINPILEGGA
jgi:L-serine dehydratase